MKLSGHTNATYGYGLEKTLELFAELGLAGLDIGCNEWSGIRTSLPPKERRKIGAQIRDSGLRISCLASYVGEGHDALASADAILRKKAIDEQRRHIDLAADLGADKVRVFCGGDVDAKDRRDRCLSQCAESLHELAAHARDRRQTLLIENHPATLTVSAGQTVELIKAVDEENVGILYDPSNLIVYGQDPDVASNLACQKAWIRHVHVKDQMIDAEGRYQDIVPGRGKIPWPQILSLLSGIDYQGHLTLEYQRCHASTEYLPDPEIGLKEAEGFLANILLRV